MNRKWICAVMAVLSCMGMLAPPSLAAVAEAAVRDVALHEGGVLLGQVVDAQGAAKVAVPVSVVLTGKEIARVKTDAAGKFAVPNLRGGVYEINSAGHRGVYRLWSPQTAPPAAGKGLMLVSESDLVRGQDCGSGVPGCGDGCSTGSNGRADGYGRAGGYRRGGVFGWMADHPIITAGSIAAAIAIPLAVDDDDPSSP